jgi:hypothetical protein
MFARREGAAMGSAAAPSIALGGHALWPWRLGGVAAALAAGALLALVVAHWGWRWFGPSAPGLAPGEWTDAKVAAIVAAAPFGRAPPVPAGPAPGSAAVPAATAAPVDLRVLGVFAGTGGDGYALLRLPERGALLVKSGEEIDGGMTLEAVYPNAVRIRVRGESRDIELRQQATPAAAPAAPGARAAAGSRPVRLGCAPPAGFVGPVYRLNAELLTGMGARPESWTAMLAPVQGALAVRDETGLAAMLGMKAGDRVAQANGIALASIDDVLAAVVKPLVASQPVRLAGTRNGQPREWLFLNAGACPP